MFGIRRMAAFDRCAAPEGDGDDDDDDEGRAALGVPVARAW